MFNNIKYAYFDLDGTLVPEGKTISNKTVEAFDYLKSKNIKVGIATGRSPYFAIPYQKLLKTNLPFVCINGAIVVNENNIVLHEKHFPDNANVVFDYLLKAKIDFLVYSQKGIYFSNIKHRYYQKLLNMSKVIGFTIDFDFKEVKELDFFKTLKFHKALVCYANEQERILIENILNKVDSITYASSQAHVLDIFNKESDKAIGIKYVIESVGGSLDDVIVFGDNENDINMFKYFKNSVALKNAKEDVKKHAKFTTQLECIDDGVADFIFKNF